MAEQERNIPGNGEDGSGGDGMTSSLIFCEDSFVFDTVSGLFYRVNPTAAFVLKALAGGTRPHEVPDLLQAHYGIDHKAALRDAELFVNELVSLGLCREELP
jgi:hypothetical protein